MNRDAVLSLVDTSLAERLERLRMAVAFSSISTDPAYHDDCVACAGWFCDQLNEIGFKARVIPVPGTGKPYVYGEALRDPGLPTVLFYGHYDVQPVDPLELWDQDPFTLRRVAGSFPDGRSGPDDRSGDDILVGRGTSDDKGQVLTFFEACRAIYALEGQLPLNVKVILEGEEESSSPSLEGFLEQHGAMLAADVALICDTGMYDAGTPAITTRLRGLVYQEFVVHGPDRDLHSGMFGGPVRNPIRVAAKIIAGLHDDDGRIMVPGFYDGLVEPSETTQKQWDGLGFDDAAFLQSVGMSQAAGEVKYGVLEQIWSRPSCDANGIVGGYTGEGSKTVLPSKASAKISFRLVPGQNPARIVAGFRQFVLDRLPADCRVDFIDHGQSAAMVVSEQLHQVKAAQRALQAEWGVPAILTGCGGSLPIAEVFQRDLGIDSLLIGFALDDDRIHAPNEKYALNSFNKGTRSWVRILEALAQP